MAQYLWLFNAHQRVAADQTTTAGDYEISIEDYLLPGTPLHPHTHCSESEPEA